MQAIKFEYGHEHDWLLPLPGDWHLLKNFQIALMKPYFDAGLKELAKVSGYSVAAIQACSKFKKTHYFIVEVWEAMYQTMVTKLFEHSESGNEPSTFTHTELIALVSDTITQTCCEGNIENKITEVLQSLQESKEIILFMEFIQKCANTNATWKFWTQFVFEDAFAYINLYIALRSRNWELRLACLKLMAPIFSAYEHFTCKKIIAQHLADVLAYPSSIVEQLKKGCFSVSLSGRPWHSVAIDDAHEMAINKDCKTSIVRPTEDYINRIATYMPFRAKCLDYLKTQLFPEDKNPVEKEHTIICELTSVKVYNENIFEQMQAIKTSGLLNVTTSTCLENPLCHKKASQEQQCDLLAFRDIGQSEFDKYIDYYILRKSSIQVSQRKRKLSTFGEVKINKRGFSQLQKDMKLVRTCMQKKITMVKKIKATCIISS